jgi:PKD repeat protein
MKNRLKAKLAVLTPILAGILMGCIQPSTQPDQVKPQPLGLIGLKMYVGKEQGDNLPVPEEFRQSQKLSAQSTFPSAANVSFSQASYTMRIYTNPERWYMTANFKVTNNSANPLQNLSLVARNRNQIEIGGTAITSIVGWNNQTITDVQTARNLEPSNYLSFSTELVNANAADFQAFIEAEATQLKADAISAGVPLSVNDTILNYGFVARKSSTSKTIPPVSCKTSQFDQCNVGNVSVTFKAPAFQIAGLTPNLPLKLTFNSLLTNETINRVTRAEENTASAIARAQTLGATEVALVGADTDLAPPLNTVRVPVVRRFVEDAALASFDLETPIGTVGSSVNFDGSGSGGSGVTYNWNFGDGTSSTDAIVNKTYANPGLYNAVLTVTDSAGRTQQKTVQVAVLPEIQNISPNLSLSGSDIANFDAGDPLPGFAYQWDFGDNTTGTGSRVSHSYPALGTYVVKLKIIDNRPLIRGKVTRTSGGGSLAYQNETWLTHWEPKPKAKFALSSSFGTGASFGIAPFTVNFNATASTGSSALTYSWNFGDGTTATGAQVSRSFNAGEHIVKLTVTDAKGQTDTYRAYVVAKAQDITAQPQNAFFRPAFNYPSTTRAKTVDPLDLLPASRSVIRPYAARPQAGTNYIDYFPYVMHKSATFPGIGTRWNAWSNGGNFRNVFCNSVFTYYNQVQTNHLKFENSSNPDLCEFVRIRNTDVPVLQAKGNSEFFVTSSLFDQTYRFDVIGGLRIPKIYIAVVPDKMIPGDKATPYTTENKGNFNGTSQLMLTVRLRQSDVNSGNIKFKVPVYAVDDTGALMTTANGYFKAAFKTTNPQLLSDCGDCVMENGKAFIEVTMPSNAYPLNGDQLDLTQISMYGNPNCGSDNSDWINKMPDNAFLNNCSTITALYTPPNGIADIPDFKYPLPVVTANFFGHIVINDTATAVLKWNSYLKDGFWDDTKTFITDFIPFIGSGKDFLEAVKACQVQECQTLGVGMIVLAGVGVIADVTPVTGELYAKFAKVFKPSKLSTKGVSDGIEKVIKEGVDAGKTVDGLKVDLDVAHGKIVNALDLCGLQCTEQVEASVKVYADELQLQPKAALTKINDDIQDPRYDALGILPQTRIADIEASVYCVAKRLAGGTSSGRLTLQARTAPKNLCPTTVTKVGNLVTQMTATLDTTYINGGTNPTTAARREVVANGAIDASGNSLDDAGHILAYVLGGPGGLRSDNIVPIRSTLNRGAIQGLETRLANLVRAGRSVTLTVDLTYVLSSIYPSRPTQLKYTYSVDSVLQTPEIFPNPI